MPVLVGWIISAVVWLFKNRIGFFLLSILAWLGIAFATTTVLVTPIINEIQAYVAGMSAEGSFGESAMAYLRYLQFDKALTMVFSAYAARAGLSAGRVFMAKRAA